MIDDAKRFLFPRLCPEIRLNKDDLSYANKKFGEKEVIDSVHSIITSNYIFPHTRYTDIPAPPRDNIARFDCPEMKKTQSLIITSPKESTISTLRVSRKSSTDPLYPGITLSLTDKFAYDDSVLSDLVESCVLGGWCGTSKSNALSPEARYLSRDHYEKLLFKHTSNEAYSSILDSTSLRKYILGSSEIVIPHVELYTYILNKLKPKHINIFETGFGSSVMALLRYSTFTSIKCVYNTCLKGMSEKVEILIKTFKRGESTFDVMGKRSGRKTFDLVIGEFFPFETYHMTDLIESTPEDYHEYMSKNIFLNMKEQTKDLKEDTRIVIVLPLRESKKHPTIEPLILFILAKLHNITFAGNLVSYKKDFIVLLLITKDRSTEEIVPWSLLFDRLYPELSQEVSVVEPYKIEGVKQPPRKEIIFPSKMRICPFTTTVQDNGDTVYHFAKSNCFEEIEDKKVEEISEPCGFDTDDKPQPPTIISIDDNHNVIVTTCQHCLAPEGASNKNSETIEDKVVEAVVVEQEESADEQEIHEEQPSDNLLARIFKQFDVDISIVDDDSD